jgi:hypothetical protein
VLNSLRNNFGDLSISSKDYFQMSRLNFRRIINFFKGSRFVKNLRFKWICRNTVIKQREALASLKGKPKIKVVFFLIFDSVWKYEVLYDLMTQSERFDPIVIICPYLRVDESLMKSDMEKAFITFKNRGYKISKSLKQNGEWLDVRNEIQPDIIFFTSPYNITHPNYLIDNFLDRLTCYVPYNFGNSHLLEMFHDKDFHNYLWKLFAETEIHKEFSEKVARNKGKNVIVSGFPGTDKFLIDDDKEIINVWKNKKALKIIWAPHHTIDDNKAFLSFSSFLLYHDFFIKLIEKNYNKIEIAFKPHPLLKVKLSNHPDWGVNRTNAYYQKWNDLKNGFLAEGDYIDLFRTSDAMIHDSGSFLIEYLYTGKPVLRTDVDDNILDRINRFGRMAYNVHYIAKTEKDISDFIDNMIKGIDSKKEDRRIFKQNWLIPPNGKLASENIMDYLIAELQ